MHHDATVAPVLLPANLADYKSAERETRSRSPAARPNTGLFLARTSVVVPCQTAWARPGLDARVRSGTRTQMLDPIEFCEIVRAGDGGVPIACVGDARPIPFVLAQIPASVPVIHLKLDGTHVWPPQYFSACHAGSGLCAFARKAVFAQRSGRNGLVLRGTARLRTGNRFDPARLVALLLLMIEPETPWRFRSFSRYRLLRRKAGKALRRVQAIFDPNRSPFRRHNAQPPVDPSESGESRWNLMTTYYQKNIHRIRPKPFQRPLTLVGSELYQARFGQAWRRIAKGNFEQCIFANTASHAAFAQPAYSQQWLSCLNHWYKAMS